MTVKLVPWLEAILRLNPAREAGMQEFILERSKNCVVRFGGKRSGVDHRIHRSPLSRKVGIMKENPYNVGPFDIHLYEGHNTHPAVVADPSKAKKPGWQSGYPQRYLLGNPALGIYLVHAIRMMPDGKTPMYDHYMRFERSGGVFLPFDCEGRVGLLPVPRPTTRDPEGWNKAFDEKPPRFDYSLLGRISWEAPRGFGKKGESGSQTTAREAAEEMQGMVIREFDGGWLVDNTTYCPHMTKVSFGMVDTSRAPIPMDKLEADIGGKAKYYTMDEIDELERRGDVYDAFTLSALHRFERALKTGKLSLKD